MASASLPSSGVSGDAATFFVAAFACIIVACVASLAIVHRWWRREAAALEEERVARAEATNPWTIRARRERERERSRGRGSGGDDFFDDAFDAEGSGKTEILDGSVVRGFMYGLYVVNPSGSFTFASEKVETNRAAVEARRRAKERAGAGEANDETPRTADETRETDAAGTDATSGVDRGVFAASDAAGEARAAAAALAAAIESASAEESALTRVSVDPWDTTTSNADSGTARDADEGRVRGARRSFSATRPGPGPGPEDGTR